MALINKTLPGQFNGVSQQVYNLRSDSQCENQENAINSLTDGVYKRHKSSLVKKLYDYNNKDNNFYHYINRDKEEKYLFEIDDTGTIKAYGDNGEEYTVQNYVIPDYTLPAPLDHITIDGYNLFEDYLQTDNPNRDLRAVSVADITIITNRNKIVKRSDVETTSEIHTVYTPLNYVVTYPFMTSNNVAEVNLQIDNEVFVLGTDFNTDVTNGIDDLVSAVNNSFTYNARKISDSEIYIERKDGEKIFNISGYFNTSNYNEIFTATVVSNGGQSVTLDSEHIGYVYIKNGIAEQTYTVELTGHNIIVNTGTSTDPNNYKTTSIVSAIVSEINTNTAGDYAAESLGNIVKIYRTDGDDFNMKVYDSWGDAASLGIKDKVDSELDLPATFYENVILEIVGKTNSKKDNYYVIYLNGKWIEWRKKDIPHKYEQFTLPIQITRTNGHSYITSDNPNGIYFVSSIMYFNERKVGDEITCPYPSFVDSTIDNILFFENRLCMLSNNNIVFSRSGDFYNFFPTTATEVLDDDPIDISASSTNVSNIKYGVPFNNTLILFTDSEQFKLSSNQGILTPKSVNIDPTTKFDLDDLSQPIGLGSNVYFANKKGKFTSIREYYVQEDTLTNDASDITAHVPNYIYKDVLKIVGNTSSDNLFVLTEDNRNEIFVYKYYWNGNEKVQSAWNKWTFEENILNIEIINNYLYIISEFKGEVFMSKINLEKETMYDLNFDYHLDYFTELEDITYNAGTNETTISVPYNINSIENFTDKYIIADNKGFNIGSSFNVLGVSEKDIIIQGDKTTLGTISIGRKFNMIHQFSRFSLKSQGTNVSEVEGRLQLTKINISYNNSIYFEVKIKPKGRSVSTKIFNNVKVGSSIFGTIESSDGNFKSYIMTNSDNEGIWLENSCHYPFGFQTISWEGQYTKRSQTV